MRAWLWLPCLLIACVCYPGLGCKGRRRESLELAGQLLALGLVRDIVSEIQVKSDRGNHPNQFLAALRMPCVGSCLCACTPGSRERWILLLITFSFFICSGSLDHGTILPMLRVGLPTSVKTWENLPRLHPRVYLPDESIICVLKLTIKTNQHTQNTWKHWKYANSLTYLWSFCVGEMFAFVFRALRSCIRDTDLRGVARDLI